jgi:phage tail-like protein
MKPEPKFFYLNIGDSWPKFELVDLEIAKDGALQLRALPRLVEQAPENLNESPVPQGPAGIARSDDGALFFTEPEAHRLWRVDPCDPGQVARPAACIGGEGGDATQFKFPRGLLFLPGRGLLIADSCNHRIQIVDPHTLRVLEIWNGADAHGNPLLREPWTMALDSEYNVYVIVAGDHSLRKIDPWGRIDRIFQQNIDASCASYPPHCSLSDPVAIAVCKIDGEERLLVLDREWHTLIVFDLDGRWQKTFALEIPQAPLTLAVSDRAIYIGDNGDQYRNVLQFDIPSLGDERLNFVGVSVGYRGPIAALFLDCQQAKSQQSCDFEEKAFPPKVTEPCDLLLSTGNGAAPIVLKEGAGYGTCGFAVAGPFDFRRLPVAWHRLQSFAETLPPHAHARFFFLLDESPSGNAPERPPLTNMCSPPQETLQGWCAFPPDVTDGLFESFATGDCSRGVAPGNVVARPGSASAISTYLWLALSLSGDGVATPRIHQIRLQFNHESYLPYLPAIYSEDRAGSLFLLSLLSLFESFFAEQESAIARLPALFDPAAAPAEFLPWLAEWLAQDIREEWSDERKRRMIAEAFAAYALRGTPAGLRMRIQRFTGAQAVILEPVVNADLWSLGETSTLDFDTMLAPAEAQGAVLGTTATLDRSHLITDVEFGAPLFEDVAHRFTVVIYPDAVGSARKKAELTAVIERDKPAHTDWQLCVIQPAMRVGFQSLVGIDTVVGGPELPTPLAETSAGGLVLAGAPTAGLGAGSRVGVNAQLF